jgi:uncharacterized protein YdaU (DUF1376 family)
MGGVPYIRFFSDDWLSGTNALSLEERGALITLVALTASTGEPPKADFHRLSRQLGCTPGRAKKIIEALIDLGKIGVDGGSIINRRALTETEISQKNSEKQSEIARSRWSKNPEKSNEIKESSDAMAQPRQCQPEPEPEPYKKEEAKASSKKGSRLPRDWSLPQEWADWSLAQGMDELSSRREADRFRDYWVSAPGQRGVKLDWQAVWRNWVRKWIDERDRRGYNSPPRPRIRARLPEEYQ